MPDDSRTEDSTVGGRGDRRIVFADESGFWNEGELMIVVLKVKPLVAVKRMVNQ